MKSPREDPGFAVHPVHGAAAQFRLVQQVLRRVPGREYAIDVGAHIGTWTLPLAAQFKQVLAIEPVEANRACLVANLDGLENVTVLDVAVGARPGQGAMRKLDDNSGTYHLEAGDETAVLRLDGLCPWTRVDFLKLDIEGMEGWALSGAREILTEFRPAVFFEDNGVGQRYYGESWLDPKTVLAQHGYQYVMRVAKNELWIH